MTNRFAKLGFTALALVASPALVAQTSTTGSVNGVVADKGGAPVAGATILMVSGQISRTVVTDAEGRFSASLLNPGRWTCTVSKPGYTTTKQTVSVSINTNTLANFKMGKEGSATVEVVASATAVDTTSTTTGSNFSMDVIADVPKGRDIGDVAFMTPGVSFSGFNASDSLGLNISIAGASGAENSFSVDGLKTNDMRYGGQGVSMSQEFVDQIEVQTGGYKPEYSAMGGVFNVLTKSGTNTFAGSAWADMSPGSLSPALKKNAFYSESKPVDTYQIGALASGAFIKDKFFYAVGLNLLQTNTPSSPNLDGLSVGAIKTPTYQFFAKFNYYLNTDNQLTASYFGSQQTADQDNNAATPGDFVDGHGNMWSGNKTKDNSNNFSLIWDSALTTNFSMSVKLGQASRLNQVTPKSDTPEVIDYTYFYGPRTGFPGGAGYGQADEGIRWATGGYGTNEKETNLLRQGSIDFTWVLGNHSVKGGFSHMTSRYETHSHRSGAESVVWYTNMAANGELRISKRLYTNDSVANAEFQALYLQDTWQVTKNLNLFYGARAEHQTQKGNNGKPFMEFKFTDYIQPRIGFTWDIKGDATSKLSGSFAEYYEQIPQRMAIRTYGNEDYFRYNYYGSGYTGPVLMWNAAASTQPWTLVNGQTPVLAANYSLGWSHDPIADGVKLPKRIEYQLGYDQQVSTTTTLGIHGRYRKLTNPLEDSELVVNDGSGTPLDPNDDVGQAVIWNPRPGKVSFTNLAGQHVTVDVQGYPEAYNEYKAVDVSYTYKTANTLLFLGYTWSRNYGNYEGLISPSNGQADGNITASYDYQPYVGTGLLPVDHEHAFKAYGYHKFLVGQLDSLTLGFNFMAQSGTPISKQDNGDSTYGAGLGDPGGYGNATFVGGLMGNYGRTQTQTKLDVNMMYTHVLANKMKLSGFLQIYNLYNYRPALSVFEQAADVLGNMLPDGKWRSPTTYQAPRSFRFGVKLAF
ncbi:TonB-dependent receptor [Mesoterricola sediminis]|uniref:Membrane protein n=1 Tax=Mesoterricola sediminis TaxID=2927980 RepID=A0AA48GWD5_9BACT|nr:TonB-dependent receptor [Mesoterricola sediminis]BDU78837.1 membrane protein [Mesoterricola sediminis]